jgi:hypothetical protein
VKIKLIHDLCGREVLVQQVLESQGHCPWDGKAFSRDYTAILAEGLEQAEGAGSVLENALEKIGDMGPGFTVDERSVLRSIEARLQALNRAGRARQS